MFKTFSQLQTGQEMCVTKVFFNYEMNSIIFRIVISTKYS